MSDNINYKELLDTSMRNMVRDILRNVQENGLHGEQHFYITFQTNYPGVILSDDMLKKYPHDITIVIQHQFWNFQVRENLFSIDLSFGNKPQTVVIPFNAITTFADPSEEFAIHLEKLSQTISPDETSITPSITPVIKSAITPQPVDNEKEKSLVDAEEDNVVALDSFRKK